MRRVAIFAAMVASLQAQQPETNTGLSPETLLLARIRLHMSENLQRQPNYTCLETVERTRRPKGGRAQVQDTLRLEVALVNGKEMFAWPGSKVFEDKDLSDLVTTGTFGNGNFAIHARSVFMGSGPTFTHRGEENLNGRMAVRYDFRVERLASGYTMRVNDKEAIVGFHGSFWADPRTLDVRRLQVFADDIPKYLGVDSTSDQVEYKRLPIGGAEFLLPVDSVLEMNTVDGESRNFVRFTNCRQYSGDSVLKFTEEVREDAVIAAVEEVRIPGDVDLRLALADELELGSVAVGDRVKAELRSDAKHSKEVVAPKGAVVRGRITRFERRADRMVLGVTFDELEWPGHHASWQGFLVSYAGIQYGPNEQRRWPQVQPKPGEGIVMLPASQRKLSRGMLFYWRTDR